MTVKTFRPYQHAIWNAVVRSYKQGNRRILIQLPTGSGKSIFFSKLINSSVSKNNSILFLVHRRELINQAFDHLSNENIDSGIIMAKVMPEPEKQVQLASIQTLWSRCFIKKRIPVPRGDGVVIDEAHRVGSETYDKILSYYKDAFLIGVTATPIRKNGKGLGHYFDDLILGRDHGAGVRQLIDAGYLAEPTYMVPNVPDLSGVQVARGDYVEDQLAEVMNDAKLVGNIVDHYLKFAQYRKAIAFAVNVAHSVHITNAFNAAGIPAAHIDGKTPLRERNRIIQEYITGKYQILSNCDVFPEGFDMPDVDAVIGARPTKSLRLYLQMGGRGLRPKPDNGDCLILDHTGNYFRHGPLDEEHEWSLDERTTIQKRDQIKREQKDPQPEVKEYRCGNCGHLFKRQALCPKCGTPLPQHAEDVETAMGELIPIGRKAKSKKPTHEDKQRWWSYFITYANQKGYKSGWAFHQYKTKFGVAPQGLETRYFVGKEYPQEFKNYLTHLRIKWAKSKHHANHSR